jgi:antitoxin VapB
MTRPSQVAAETVGTAEQVAADVRCKQERILEFLDRQNLDALILGRQDNFAWLTSGGDNRVVTTTEMGAALAVVTRDEKWLVAYPMDCRHILEEEAPRQGFEPVVIPWHDGPLAGEVRRRTRGMRVGADFALSDSHLYGSEITALHYPFTDLEVERCRWVGRTSARILTRVAAELRPGTTEREAAARLLHEYALAGMTIDVLLVGFDGRIARYRHPAPTDQALGRYALLHPAARRWGLHANVTRLVHFGSPPPETQKAIDAVVEIAGRVVALLEPEARFADILTEQKRLYGELGYAEEWRQHFQGGITGYTLADATCCLNSELRVRDGQAFDYFVTITGAKSEDLVLLTGGRAEVASIDSGWPTRSVETGRGVVRMPDVWIQ